MKMDDLKLNCSLCCDKTFNSKQALIDHLTGALDNLYCPICQNKWTSLAHLIEHLSLDICLPQLESIKVKQKAIVFEEISQDNSVDNAGSSISVNKDVQNDSLPNAKESYQSDIHQLETQDEESNNKMYVELLGKQLMKPCLQTQELKLVKEDGGISRYMIVTQDSAELSEDSTIVTKQNQDGTISLTTVKDMKVETDTLIARTETEPEESQEEVYSCNTCGVSFTSVLEHIQIYHNDQDVVVEEPIEEGSSDIPMEYDALEEEESSSSEKVAPRRVITDTGDIVEAPLITEKFAQESTVVETMAEEEKDQTVEKQGRIVMRRYVQVDNLCEGVIKDLKQSDAKSGPYHRVVIKEVLTSDGTSVKMYHCMSCNIYVSDLDEFKSHPCKTLKYFCPQCPVVYENSKSLCAHMKAHKIRQDKDEIISYECEICGTVFPSNKSLKLHKRMHDPIKSRPIDPPAVPNTDEKYCCNVCNKMIPVDYLTIHQNSHKSNDKMTCSICNKKFNSMDYLKMHMNVHNMDKPPVSKQDKTLPYRCYYCDRRFARPHEKVKHERIHTGEKPHSCEICGKSFRVSYCLTLHMRTHTGARPYACQHCGKRFKAHSVYNHHLLTHSEVRAYKCPYCPKAFKTSVQLAGHKNSHTKPFSCQHCNRPFASLYAVRVHTETHARQNNLKFSCTLCGASYARAFALKDHVKQVHKQDVDTTETTTNVKDEDWLNKDLSKEINDLEMRMTTNELLVPQ